MLNRQPIFREAALERLASPEGLDQAIQVTNPRAWLALAAVGLVLATAVFWGIYGSVTTKVSGTGLLARAGGMRGVSASDDGQVSELWVRSGGVVEEGEVVAVLYRPHLPSSEQTRYVVSPCAGRVVDVRVQAGQVIQAGTVVADVEPLNAPVEAVVYVPAAEGKRIRPGMDAQIAPSMVKPEEDGYLLGKVRSVGSFPSSLDAIARVVGTRELAAQFSAAGPPYEVRVELLRDPDAPGGFEWSSAGPKVRVPSGALCAARVVVERQRPVSLVIPLLRDKLGLYTGPTFEEPAAQGQER